MKSHSNKLMCCCAGCACLCSRFTVTQYTTEYLQLYTSIQHRGNSIHTQLSAHLSADITLTSCLLIPHSFILSASALYSFLFDYTLNDKLEIWRLCFKFVILFSFDVLLNVVFCLRNSLSYGYRGKCY